MINRNPLFILAPPSSNAAHINAMIGEHPQAFGFPELNLFVADKLRHLSRSLSKDGLLRTVGELYAGEQSIASLMMARRWLARRHDFSTADLYHGFIEKISPLIGVEYSASYANRPDCLQRILQAFPDARFLHVTRHPLTQCQSAVELEFLQYSLLVADSVDYSGDEAVLDPQIAWHDTHVNILQFLEQLPEHQWRRVRSERLLAEIDSHLVSLCDWLEIDSSANAIDAMKHPEYSAFSSIGPAQALLGNDPEFLVEPVIPVPRAVALPLNESLPWRENQAGFHRSVVELAEGFGYRSDECIEESCRGE